ncbi:MAG TPA: MATE family efflux transporter [Gammaproteobacteria bacterium]|jgi:MATE family multidrug resistance protein|nr:MATE family efflux transporter [Gammaproteobacteria bacterium]
MNISHRTVWRIAGPMMLSNLSVPLLGIVDTAVVGHLNRPAYLGAVAVGTTLFNFLYLGLNFLRMGTTGVTAQAAGRDDAGAVRATLAQGLLLSFALACILLALQWPLRRIGLELIAPSAAVQPFAQTYFDIRIWAAPAVLADYALVGWFLGLGNARAPLALVLTVNVINAALDILFVSAFGMNVGGVALASVIAEYCGLAVGAALALRALRQYPAPWRHVRLFDRVALRRLAGVNGNLFVRTLCLMMAFGFFTAMGARLGTVILAANAILLNLQSLLSYALDGFAHAAEALTGRAAGQADAQLFTRTVRVTLGWSLAAAAVFALLYALAGGSIIGLMTDLPDVRTAALAYLPWMIASPLVSVWAFEFDGVFVGATRAREMRNAMLFALACYLAIWYATQPFGNHGLWLAFILFLGARGVFMGLIYLRLGRRNEFVATT